MVPLIDFWPVSIRRPLSQCCFRGLSSDQLDDSERLRAHALSYMKVFALVADALEDQAGDAAVNEYLLMLGAKHSSFKGFDPIYFM